MYLLVLIVWNVQIHNEAIDRTVCIKQNSNSVALYEQALIYLKHCRKILNQMLLLLL